MHEESITMKAFFFLVSVLYLKAESAQAITLESCSTNPSCTSVTCRASNLTASTQELTAVFSVDPNCQEAAGVFFGLRDRTLGASLFNQSITDCFSILQQDPVEFTLGPLPDGTENITFTLIQPTNETTLLTLLVPAEPDPPRLQLQTTWFHLQEQCPEPTTSVVTGTVTTGGATRHNIIIGNVSLCLLFFTLLYSLF